MARTIVDFIPSLWIAIPVAAIGLFGFITFNALFLIWMERKVAARFQRRLGPTEVGFAGTFQTLADVGKLMGKQLITPKDADLPLCHLAPLVVFVPVILGLSLFPIDEGWSVLNVNVGLVLVFAFAGDGR